VWIGRGARWRATNRRIQPVRWLTERIWFTADSRTVSETVDLNRVLLIIPTYNERESLPLLVGQVRELHPQVHLLIVDDGSPDGTGALADRLAQVDSRLHVLHRKEKTGLGGAYLAGFAWALGRDYDFVVEMDADGSHRPADLAALFSAAPGADLVLGSRWVRGGRTVNWPLSRTLLSRGGNAYAGAWLGTGIKDMTGGFRMFRAQFLRTLDLDGIAARGYGFQVEMVWRAYSSGARIVEVPITFVERVHGQSKMSRSIVIEAMLLVTRFGLRHRLRWFASGALLRR
jgi:dolichol-phosphate mannosyltransferase